LLVASPQFSVESSDVDDGRDVVVLTAAVDVSADKYASVGGGGGYSTVDGMSLGGFSWSR